ncbi:MAG: isochorismatase family protein, partial [Planctomycetales bacterium]
MSRSIILGAIYHFTRRGSIIEGIFPVFKTFPEDEMADDDLARAKLDRIQELHRLDQGRPALIVVDMQRGFLDEGASLEVPKGREVLPNVARLTEACRAGNVPVIFTE